MAGKSLARQLYDDNRLPETVYIDGQGQLVDPLKQCFDGLAVSMDSTGTLKLTEYGVAKVSQSMMVSVLKMEALMPFLVQWYGAVRNGEAEGDTGGR